MGVVGAGACACGGGGCGQVELRCFCAYQPLAHPSACPSLQLQRTEGELRKANRLNSSMRSKVMVAEEQARMQGQDESQLR